MAKCTEGMFRLRGVRRVSREAQNGGPDREGGCKVQAHRRVSKTYSGQLKEGDPARGERGMWLQPGLCSWHPGVEEGQAGTFLLRPMGDRQQARGGCSGCPFPHHSLPRGDQWQPEITVPGSAKERNALAAPETMGIWSPYFPEGNLRLVERTLLEAQTALGRGWGGVGWIEVILSGGGEERRNPAGYSRTPKL